jgi:hypothetical protein
MVKQEFTNISQIGFVEPEIEENGIVLGNAFVGAADKEAYDREMWNALHAQNMLGDEAGPSSIANVTARTADAGGGASRRKNSKDNDTTFRNVMLLQQIQNMIANNQEMLIDIRENISDLEDAQARHANGEFDPLNVDDDRELISRNNLSVEAWNMMSIQEQQQWFNERLEAERSREASLELETSILIEIASDPDVTTADGLSVIDELGTRLEERGVEINNENLSEQDQVELVKEMMRMRDETQINEVDLAESYGVTNQTNARMNDFF